MDIIEQAIHNVKLQLGVLPISREIAEEILRSDSNSYQSQLLQHIATDSFGAAIPLNHSSLFTDAAKPHIKNTSSHGSTLEQGSDESAANMPKINSDNSTTSGSTSEIPKTNPDPPKKNVTQHSQVTHKAWDPATRNQVFIIRQIYTEYRETITSNLTKTWLSMRNSMLQHASLLPVPDETIIQFDENMKKFISRQILILQYESLRHIMRLVASPIPIGYDVSSESIKTNEEMNRLRVQAFMPPGSDLLLNYSQVVLLESSFAVSQTHSKLEKKRLAYLTGLRIGDVSRWFEMKRVSKASGQMYRVEAKLAMSYCNFDMGSTSTAISNAINNYITPPTVNMNTLVSLGIPSTNTFGHSIAWCDPVQAAMQPLPSYRTSNQSTLDVLQDQQPIVSSDSTHDIQVDVMSAMPSLTGLHTSLFPHAPLMFMDPSLLEQCGQQEFYPNPQNEHVTLAKVPFYWNFTKS